MNTNKVIAVTALLVATLTYSWREAIAEESATEIASVQEAEVQRSNIRVDQVAAALQCALKFSSDTPTDTNTFASFVSKMGDTERTTCLYFNVTTFPSYSAIFWHQTSVVIPLLAYA